MLLHTSLPPDFGLTNTPPQLIDHDYLILRITYQGPSQDPPVTIFARCERKPNPVDLGGNQFHTQTWDSISFSSDLDRIHNMDKGKAISMLRLQNVKVRHVVLLLHLIRGRTEDHEAGNSNSWWFAKGRVLELLFIASMP